MLALALTLTLSPWKGPQLAAASAGAAQYRLAVHGKANAQVHLAASGLPPGWIASFCTQDLCSPFHYAMQLDSHGDGAVEFQAVRIDDSAPRRVRVTISSASGESISAGVAAPTP